MLSENGSRKWELVGDRFVAKMHQDAPNLTANFKKNARDTRTRPLSIVALPQTAGKATERLTVV